ncbi:MAG: hypothetical protein ABIZ80_12520 [Bryobacteraceae bacterium]
MSIHVLKQIRSAVSNLNPEQVQKSADQPLAVGLVATNPEGYEAMENFLIPASVSEQKRKELKQILHRAGDPGVPSRFDLVLYERQIPVAANAFTFYAEKPSQTIADILGERQELGLVLAKNFPAFRRPVINGIIQTISKENALFALATALPNIVPSLVELPWAVGEFASDTAVITMNQIRMAFLIAAASDSEIGYREQKSELASIVAGAFGWRAVARELIGKIPFGAGLIPKGAVAYAGTYVVGLSLERYQRLGYGLARTERRAAYDEAIKHGKGVAKVLLAGLKRVDAA